MSVIRQLSSRTVYENRWLVVREDRVRRDDGSEGIYSVLSKPDFAVVIPLDGDQLTLVEQYRYPIGRRLWEFPQGSWEDEPDADPAALAAGELAEETGLRAGTLRHLGFLWEASGYATQGGHVFLATDLRQGERTVHREEQDLRPGRFAVAEFEAMIRRGEIRDGPTVAAWGLYLVHGRAPTGSSGGSQ